MSMELDEALQGRRSVRKFEPEGMPNAVLVGLVDSACLSPSAGNMQASRYVIVTGADQLRKVRAVSPGLLGRPPAVIVICEDQAEAISHAGSKGPDLSKMDAAIAAYGMCLKAYSLGLGTCIVASFNRTALSELLRLPDTVVPTLMVSVGIAAGHSRAPSRRRDRIVSLEVYDG